MIYAIRHGETNWNKEGRIQGCGSDTSLNEVGIKQAQDLAEKLAKLKISVIYSSDLMRAKQTTYEINKKLNVEVKYSPLLRETNYGIIEGQLSKITDINPNYKKICDAVDAGDNDAHFPNGESRNMVVKRMMQFLEKLEDQGNILLSTHGGILRSFATIYGGLDQKIPNCGGIKFSLDENKNPINIQLF